MMADSYTIEILEHDSGPAWTDGVAYSREGAWKRVKLAASQVVEGWPHPVFVRAYLVRKDTKTLVWSGDLRNTQP